MERMKFRIPFVYYGRVNISTCKSAKVSQCLMKLAPPLYDIHVSVSFPDQNISRYALNMYWDLGKGQLSLGAYRLTGFHFCHKFLSDLLTTCVWLTKINFPPQFLFIIFIYLSTRGWPYYYGLQIVIYSQAVVLTYNNSAAIFLVFLNI